MRTQDEELSMHKIEDYDNHESKGKRNTIRIVIAIGLIIGAIYAVFKYNNNEVSDYVGTQYNPGIVPTKN